MFWQGHKVYQQLFAIEVIDDDDESTEVVENIEPTISIHALTRI
jgi:hypothetical protein